MAIPQSDLRTASVRTILRKGIGAAPGQATAFLCHSHKDRDIALGLQTLLRESGLDLYIDWQDADMPDKPNRETALKIKSRIVSTTWFLFLATANSMSSRWCPWEIGYADGKKPIERILLVQTADSSGQQYGSEYLQLYQHVDSTSTGLLAVFGPAPGSGKYVRDLR